MKNSLSLYVDSHYFKQLVELMLSFEVSAIDIVLVVAVLALLFLHVTRKTGESETKPSSHVEKIEKLREKPKITFKTKKSQANAKQPQTGFQNCAHNFGYLRSLPKNTPVPDECFGCPKVMRCLFQNE